MTEHMKQDKKQGDPRNKGFRYPPILPVVYYEGKEDWTAGLRLKDRILLNDVFENYIPDFTYRLVRIHDYSNEELLENCHLDRESAQAFVSACNSEQ